MPYVLNNFFVNFLSEICIGLESQLDEVFNKKAIRAIFRVFQVCVWGDSKIKVEGHYPPPTHTHTNKLGTHFKKGGGGAQKKTLIFFTKKWGGSRGTPKPKVGENFSKSPKVGGGTRKSAPPLPHCPLLSLAMVP